jgi:CheY-like chemotaxis protein
MEVVESLQHIGFSVQTLACYGSLRLPKGLVGFLAIKPGNSVPAGIGWVADSSPSTRTPENPWLHLIVIAARLEKDYYAFFPMANHPVILVAEDDENDVLLLEQAFERASVPCHFEVVRNGQEAVDYLSGEGTYGDRAAHPWPTLMLLDLKMPLLNGFEVLSWWREQDYERDLPIVVMSSSNQESDIEQAMALGATAYRVKPSDFQYLVAVAQELRDRWLLARP